MQPRPPRLLFSASVKALALAAVIGLPGSLGAILPPAELTSRSGDRSVILHWTRTSDADATGYAIYRAATESGPFLRQTPAVLKTLAYVDFNVTNEVTYFYAVRAVTADGQESADSPLTIVQPRAFASDDEFLDYLQRTAFDYFWFEALPENGLIRDRSTTTSPCSIAAVGFGLTGLGIGVERNWITRTAAAERVRVTLETFWEKPQGSNRTGVIGHKGWFYHFLTMTNAQRATGSELSSVDTALFLAGALYAKQFFDGTNPTESRIRELTDSIYRRIDWTWMANGGTALRMGWHPETGFINSSWYGYNEAMILYLLAIGAPSNAVPADQWNSWTSRYRWGINFQQAYLQFAPLFGHQYSHCWIDFRHSADSFFQEKQSTYFENSRRATLAQRAYAIANPLRFSSYSSNVWGLTACDGPPPPRGGYAARGAPNGFDDGTIAPTAVGGSLPFLPEHTLPTLRYLYQRYRTNLWTVYGFRDAFNPSAGWWDPDVLGIDQGPILIMAENYRTQSVWRKFMRNPEIQRALTLAGFVSLPSVPARLIRQTNGASPLLTWNTRSNQVFQIEFSADLDHWYAPTNGPINSPLDASETTWTDPQPSTNTRFYRVFKLGKPDP